MKSLNGTVGKPSTLPIHPKIEKAISKIHFVPKKISYIERLYRLPILM